MDRKLYCGKDAEFQRRADTVLEEIKSGKGQYYDADELADIADYFALNNMHEKMRMVVEYGIHLHPDNLDIRIQEAYMHLDFNELEQAEECLSKIPLSNRDTKQLEALMAFRKGDEAKADKLMEELMANARPEDTYAIVGLLLDLGRPEEALDYLTHSDEDPEQEFYLDNLATCYRELDMLDQAIETLNKLIDRHPYQPNIWKVLGECYFDDQQYDKCIEACDFALATDEDYHPALLLKALAFQQLNNPEKAMEYIRQAYELGGLPFLGLCYFEMTNYYDGKQWQKVVDVYHKMTKHVSENGISPDNHYVGIITAYAAISLIHLGKWIPAFNIANELSKTFPDSPEVWFVISAVRMHRGLGCHRSWDNFIECDPISADLVHEAYDLCMDHFNVKDAFKLLKLNHELDPDNKIISVQLMLQSLTMNKTDALEELLSDGSLDVPREKVEEIVSQLQSGKPDYNRISQLMTEVLQSCCPEIVEVYQQIDRKVAEQMEKSHLDPTTEEVQYATPKKRLRNRKKTKDNTDNQKDKENKKEDNKDNKEDKEEDKE